MKYRADIDGLRACAVIPVVLFHAGVPAITGGFVGVDVFFVISGYVISALLLEDLKSGRFSIIAFYERKSNSVRSSAKSTIKLLDKHALRTMMIPTRTKGVI